MNKISLAVASIAVSLGAWAAPTSVMFYSQGPDKYSDGETVLDGEVYALVWSKGQFAGLNADGTLVDPANDAILAAANIAKDGKCAPICYFYESEKYPNGSLAVYMLDTRVSSTDSNGAVVKTVAGTTKGGLSVVNGYEKIDATITTGSACVADETAATGSSVIASALPADVPQPKIASVDFTAGKVVVKVEDTVPYVRYTVSAGQTPSKLDQKDLTNGLNGRAEGITLVVDNPGENRFFKITRSSK